MRFVSLLGGVERRGRWQLPPDLRVVAVVGGVDLDLTGAELPERPVLTKISLVGGVSLRVPPHVEVEVEGFRLFGRVRIAPSDRPATVHLTVRAYGLAGGVRVERG